MTKFEKRQRALAKKIANMSPEESKRICLKAGLESNKEMSDL